MSNRNDKTVLIVNNFADQLPRLAGEVRDHGYRVITASDGRYGLDQILFCPSDIIVTNINMPRMNGFQLTRAAKKLYPCTPVLLISALATYFRSRYPDKVALADDLLEQPYCMSTLLDRIDLLLGFPMDSDFSTQ